MGKSMLLASQYNEVLKMAYTTPIAITIIAAALVVIASLARRGRKGEKLERTGNEHERAFFVQWITGMVFALMVAAFMFDGHILGERAIGVSAVIWIVGICLIATSNINRLCFKHRRSRLASRTRITAQNSVIIKCEYQEASLPFGIPDFTSHPAATLATVMG
jgi:hypothetical protein